MNDAKTLWAMVVGWLVGWYFRLSGKWVADGPAVKDHCTPAGPLTIQLVYSVNCE